VQRDIDPPDPVNDNPENLFYFLVEITLENCGGWGDGDQRRA